MSRTGSLSIIRSLALYTQQQVHVIQVMVTVASSQQNLSDIYLLLCVQCQTPDDGQRNCPKHVDFYSKNKFKKLVNFVGFIIRIYYDAGSSECQIHFPAFAYCVAQCFFLWLDSPSGLRPPDCRDTYCCVYSCRLLMMDRKTVRNMQSSVSKINLRNQCISLVLL